MTDLDDALRDGLAALAGPSDGGDADAVLDRVATKRRRRHRRRLVQRAAVVIVLGVAGGALGYNLLDGGDEDRVEVVGEPDLELTQAVSYHGIEVLVPAAWQVNAAHCGTPQEDTILLPNTAMMAACLVREPPGLTVVDVSDLDAPSPDAAPALATEPVTVDGGAGQRGVGIAGPPGAEHEASVLVLPDPGVVVTVRGPDRGLRERILDHVRITPVDSNGCPDRVASLDHPPASGRAEAVERTVPGEPISASLCRYEDLWLAQSAPRATGEDLRSLVELLNGLPEGVSLPASDFGMACDLAPDLCEQEGRRGFVLRFEYAEGPPVVVHVRIAGGAEMSVANGDRTTKLSADLVVRLTQTLGYGWGFPDPRNLR